MAPAAAALALVAALSAAPPAHDPDAFFDDYPRALERARERKVPILVDVWAPWCPPCRYEMPGIQAAYEKYKDRGLVVLGIDFTVQDNLPDVKSFIQELNLTFPILLDETGEVSAGLYGMRGLPTSYFIDTEGNLQRIQIGAMLPEKLEEFLAEILVK